MVHFTVSFAGINASADVDLNATLPPVVKARVEEFAHNESSVVVKNIRPGAKHGIGGAWTAHLLAAVGAVRVISSAAGFIGVTSGSIGALLVHLFFCAVTFVMAVVGAHLVTDHADDTKAYFSDHWREIQTGLVGEDVAAEDAGRLRRSTCARLRRSAPSRASYSASPPDVLSPRYSPSTAPSTAARDEVRTAASREALRATASSSTRRARATNTTTTDGATTGGATGGATPVATTTTAKFSSRRNAPTDASELLHAAAAAFDATPRRRNAARRNGSGMSPSGSGSRVGDAVLEMTDLAKMVGEARGGRGRFKSRGGKSSRTPSPEPEVERRSSRESSPQRKARLPAGRRRLARRPPAARMDESLLSLLSRVTGGIKTANGIGGGFTAASDGRQWGGTGDVRVPRRDRAGTHTRGQVAAAVSMLREAAASGTGARRWRRCARRWRWRAGRRVTHREALGRNFSIPPGSDAEFTLE